MPLASPTHTSSSSLSLQFRLLHIARPRRWFGLLSLCVKFQNLDDEMTGHQNISSSGISCSSLSHRSESYLLVEGAICAFLFPVLIKQWETNLLKY